MSTDKNRINPKVEKAWTKEAERRLDEIEDGQVETIPGEQVVRFTRERLSK